MNKKKILIVILACMFLASMLPGLVGTKNIDEYRLEERRFVNQKDLKGVLTQNGYKHNPGARGKPMINVDITSPEDGTDVSGFVTITVDATKTPTILIDGSVVATGFSYQ